MEVIARGMQQRRSAISFDALSSMVFELMSLFERQNPQVSTTASAWLPDWVSPSTKTRVIRHGRSASLHHVLVQAVDTVTAEYEVLYEGVCVFTWREYLRPHLSRDIDEKRARACYLPQECLDELMDFHVHNRTHWLERYQQQKQPNGSMEIDKVGVMAQAHFVDVS